MNKNFRELILQSTGAKDLKEDRLIQNLWSGYGKVLKYKLINGNFDSVVVKHVSLPNGAGHPRGWDTELSHQRKIKSYEVETQWYTKWSTLCNDKCKIPTCYAVTKEGDQVLMVLENLDANGYPKRLTNVGWDEIKACLRWLANFHAAFMGQQPDGLWEIGTYWHLDTRPDELKVIEDLKLKEAAPAIDKVLNNSPFKTFVHGDAKLANFCFSADGKSVAAVDFQYVGGGCGMKDVAYFIGSCLHEDDCERMEDQLLDFYFKEFRKAIRHNNSLFRPDDIEENWRNLYPYAWTDFHRFLKGWSPDHWKINSYSERMAKQVVEEISESNDL